MLEGLYNGGGTMRQANDDIGAHWPAGVADHITIELHDPVTYSTIIGTVTNVSLSTTGIATAAIPGIYNGSYFVTIKHRNSVETTTAAAVSFAGASISQSYGSTGNVFGGNMKSSGELPTPHYLIYGGDVNHDGGVDTDDYIGIDNDSYNYVTGYFDTDVDGNGTVDTNDYIIVDNNNYNYIGTVHP
jgi:hypothetical protein